MVEVFEKVRGDDPELVEINMIGGAWKRTSELRSRRLNERF